MLLTILSIVSLLTLAVYCAFRYRLNHWKRHGIPQLRPSVPFGDFGPVFRQERLYGEVLADLYHQSQPLPLVGIYVSYRPVLIAVDPKLIEAILVRDSACFGDRGLYFDGKRDPMSANLFSLTLDQARELRARLDPAFSSVRMQGMFWMLSNTAFTLVKALERSAGNVVEVRDVMGRYTADGVASVLFGLEADSINDEHEMFREIARKAVSADSSNLIRIALYFIAPRLKNCLGFKYVDPVVESFMIEMVRKISEHRNNNKEHNKDLMQILLDLRRVDSGMKEEIVAAHALFFLIASFETTTTATSFCLYELAKNVEIQRKAQREIDSVISKDDGELTVENMADMRYIDCCINESYRKYPSVPFLTRRCAEDYLVPDSNYTIPSESTVIIPLQGLARDPEIYPDPESFNPERFENKPEGGLPFYPFGDGPRSCVAMRLGHLQTKVALVMLLEKFDIMLANRNEEALRFDPKFFITIAVGGLNLVFMKRECEE